MNIALWIFFCLLASIGAVQLLSWLICAAARPPGQAGQSRACQIIQLARDPGLLEQQLRYEIHLMRWASTTHPGQLILLDTGLCREAREVCRNMLQGMEGVIICRPKEVAELICWGEGPAAETV
ncbi:MAG: hypothetical protein FWE19_07245 [Oscillospiraceae bacterium]|nr:hypothetical protein [Oscillospiraceae bacterium]